MFPGGPLVKGLPDGHQIHIQNLLGVLLCESLDAVLSMLHLDASDRTTSRLCRGGTPPWDGLGPDTLQGQGL